MFANTKWTCFSSNRRFVDKDFINFIHSLTTNTKLITYIDSWKK